MNKDMSERAKAALERVRKAVDEAADRTYKTGMRTSVNGLTPIDVEILLECVRQSLTTPPEPSVEGMGDASIADRYSRMHGGLSKADLLNHFSDPTAPAVPQPVQVDVNDINVADIQQAPEISTTSTTPSIPQPDPRDKAMGLMVDALEMIGRMRTVPGHAYNTTTLVAARIVAENALNDPSVQAFIERRGK